MYTCFIHTPRARAWVLAALALAIPPAWADETFVVDANAGTNEQGALFRVDPVSGLRTLVSDFGDATQGPAGAEPSGLALEANGTVLVIDQAFGTNEQGALFRVDPVSGLRTLVSDFGDATQGPTGPIGLALEADGTVLVIDFIAGTNFQGALFRVDPVSGLRTLLSDFGDATQGLAGSDPFGLALEANGRVLVIDANAGTNSQGALFRVERLAGLRVEVSDFGDAGQGDLGTNPVGVAVVVPSCFGRIPTLVGDNGNNVLLGSPGADVIAGREGDDLIDGRGGDDRICGGEGNDALRGGSGKDRAGGEAGADTLEGGSGNDRLDGGTGPDVTLGGKGTDRCKSGEAKLGCER